MISRGFSIQKIAQPAGFLSQDLPLTTAGIAAAAGYAGYADGANVNGRAAPLAPVTIGAAEPREEAARRGGFHSHDGSGWCW